MAAMASSSVAPIAYKYDVFLSFRGEDTRKNFTSHLYAALCRDKVLAFIDNNLVRGEEISSTLLRTIEESKLSIVIFSKNYASSRWCLDELVCIMKCKEEREHIVLPVFYDIDPSDVRHQKGSYADAFAKHEVCYKDIMSKVQEWRKALTAAANISGFDSQDESMTTESKLVEKIVKAVLEKLYSISNVTCDDFTGLVGIEKRFEKIKSLLHVGYPDNVRVIGIWGMGGIGKTTLAEIVYNRFFHQFEGCYFGNVGEELSENELRHLKRNLFSELLNDKNQDHMHSSFANDRLRRKKVLLVLDNVNERKQLDCLLGDHFPISASQRREDRFGIGSRIILTSRDRKLLMTRAHEIYEVEELDFDEARRLFYWKAFGGYSPMLNFVELSNRIVKYAQGNPLALSVLGSHLRSRTTREWESALIELEKAPYIEINQVLKISYDALDDRKKSTFLDIACFLIGEDRDLVDGILGNESHLGINILIEKSLVIIKDCKLSMHELVRQMAWEIVRGDPKEVGQRRRLCNAQDVYDVLKNNKGTAIIEGIFLDLSEIHEGLCLRSTAFEDMCSLRFLKIHKPYDKNSKLINIPKGLRYLPYSLRYLVWPKYPLKSLASNFEPQNLVKLDMCSSKIKELWNGVKHLGNVKDIDLSFCEELIKLPDLSQAPKLEKLNLRGCKNLHGLPNISASVKYLTLRRSGIETFPSSFGSLENLVKLDLRSCERLASLPKLPRNIKTLSLLACQKLESLPSNIWELKTLKKLNLSQCSRLKILPEISEVVEHIRYICLDRTGIQELPSSIENLIGLRYLELIWCPNLKLVPKGLCTLSHLSQLSLVGLKLGCFPSILLGFHSLTSLDLSYCNIPEIPDWLGCLSSLIKIDLRGNSFERIPSCIRQLYHLMYLNISRCKNLRHIVELQSSIQNVEATECTSLKTVANTSIMVVNELARSNWTEDEVGFLFFNCWKLDRSARNNVLINFLSQVFRISSTGCEYSSNSLAEFTTVRTCYPGNKIPKWFNNQCEGPTTTIKLPPNWLNNKFLGFATCVIIECEPCFNINTTIHFITNYGEKEEVCNFRVFFTTDTDKSMEKENLIISSDHVFIWYANSPSKFHDMNLEAVEASFDFSCHLYKGGRPESMINVKRCGIRMIYLPEAEEEGPSQEDFMIKQDLYLSNGSCSEESVSSGCLISELVEEPELSITNHPAPSGTEAVYSDAEKSRMQRIKCFDFCSCLPFLSILTEWKVKKEN